ncbi:MFS transporter [Cellulomonas bogoriensis]|uniref:MFS transporter n=1 Tax=Cellulomonas bogoriensis 69B4 = DSM 16987 TaxID=1386082 RepID=A0A0A0BXJ7_9CELL|nr:MFS transporter [Cellulomonas bogoriensis]KGM12417.1 hypothetical protein N869_01695 [Cellulomonas bogoriensis 69B4 = DSM 16987]
MGVHRTAWRRFAAAYAANISGDRLADLAVPVTSVAAVGGIQLAGVYIAAHSLPRLLLGPTIAGVVQRHPHRSWCAYGNWIQAGALAFLALMVLTGQGGVWSFAVAGTVAGAGSGVFGVSVQATIRGLVPNRRLAAANSTLEVIDSTFTLLVPLLAGVLVDLAGPAPVLGLTSLAFAAAALMRTGIPAGEAPQGPPVTGGGPTPVRHVARVLAEPFRGPVRRFISVSLLLLGGLSVMLIPVATFQISQLGGTATSVGVAISAAGAGGLLTSLLAGRLTGVTRSSRWAMVMMAATAASLPLVFLSPAVGVVIVLVGVVDGLASWLFVSLPTMRMATEKPDALVAVSAGQMSSASLVALAVGAGLTLFGEGTSLVVFVALAAAAAICVLAAVGSPSHLRQVQQAVDV